MKKIIFVVLLSFVLVSCRKWFMQPTDVLPPYSETGANTFGCTVDGKVFVPQSKVLLSRIPSLVCFYQLVNLKRTFVLAGSDDNSGTAVSVILDSVHIKPDSIYKFDYYNTSANSARWFNDSGETYYTKLPNYTGELHIKHFDSVKQIVSGTFWFDGVDSVTNRVVKIRDGRFDVRFNY